MSTRSGRGRANAIELSPPRTRKGISPPRSPARTRKTSPAAKSSPLRKTSPPARSARKSPSRKSPSRKSPSRKSSKFPARKSPSRTTKDTNEDAYEKSPARRPAIKPEPTVATKLDDLSSKIEIYRSTRSKRTEYSIKDVTSTTGNDLESLDNLNGLDSTDVYGLKNRKLIEDVPPRRSSRLREFIDNVPEIRRSLSKSVSKSVSKSISQSLDAYSDEENSADESFKVKSKPASRKLATPLRGSESKIIQMRGRWEFGGRIGSAFLILLIPATVISIIISCGKSCSANTLLDLPTSLDSWFSIPIFTVIICQFILQLLLAILPIFGTKADRLDETGTKYCFNAFFSSIFTANLVFILDFFEILDKESFLNNYLKMAGISYILAVILSGILYLKSRKIDNSELNLYGNTGYVLYDYFMGREIHPFIKDLDVKIWMSRISNINALILTAIIFNQGLQLQSTEIEELSINNLKELWNKLQLKPTILLFSMMQLVYVLNFVMQEYKVTTTFFWQSEGVGYLQVVSSALYPFYFTTISKFVADSQLTLSTNILISASIVYVLGFFIMLVSNNIKHKFRKNPLQPGMANLESMPTFHGKKLLVSSLWGILRHPNYTGDILIHIALAMPGIFAQKYIAAAPAIFTILVLLHRAWRDHSRCSRRYGAAWSRYCKRVPSLVIPKLI